METVDVSSFQILRVVLVGNGVVVVVDVVRKIFHIFVVVDVVAGVMKPLLMIAVLVKANTHCLEDSIVLTYNKPAISKLVI